MELAEKVKAALLEDVEPHTERASSETAKRVFDFCFAVFLLPLLAPFMALIAILIKLDSKGPVLFHSKRVGKGGVRFSCLKFRTMVVNAENILPEILKDLQVRREWKENIKLKNDPRITRIGSYLRKFSLDELPQIFNVLRGDMSFVGPRPILEEETAKYGRDLEYYQSIRPGITGLWQINGRNNSDYSHRIKLMKKYVLEKTLTMDLEIILKTLPAVLSRKGAY
jgi:lipopolysaccharide/colanic/teichoic acid biosynthesis glycosyltransferase